MTAKETIEWIDAAAARPPDAESEVLVCYERNDCESRDVTLAVYDDSSEDESPWSVRGGLTCFGIVVYWAEIPNGPSRSEPASFLCDCCCEISDDDPRACEGCDRVGCPDCIDWCAPESDPMNGNYLCEDCQLK